MSTIDFEAWGNIVSEHLNEVPMPTMIDAVREAAIEFCQRTKIWSEFVGGVNYVASLINIQVPIISSGSYPYMVESVWVDGAKVQPADKAVLDLLFPEGWLDARGPATRFICPRPDVLRLVPAPQSDFSGIKLEVIYQPTRNSIEVPMFLYELYARTIGFKAIAILNGHEKSSYANPDRIAEFEGRFNEGVSWASHKQGTGFNRPHLQTAQSRI